MKKTRFELELSKGAVRLFEKVLGTRDPKAIADDIFNMILAEFGRNSAWCQLEDVEWFVIPRRRPDRTWSSAGNRGARLR